jgi:hypothetical protein
MQLTFDKQGHPSGTRAVAGQEFILFSWRLVMCDAFIMLYILIITFYLLLLGSNLTTNVVISAVFTYVNETTLCYRAYTCATI